MYIILDERIKELREQNGLTQTELAKKIGVTRSSVNGWEITIHNLRVRARSTKKK